MTKSKRLQPVAEIMESRERDAARALGEQLRHLSEKQDQLRELLAYREEYSRRLQSAGGAGIGANRMQDFQRFLDRINAAIHQQHEQVAMAQRSYEEQRQQYFRSRLRAKAVDTLMTRYRRREQQIERRREQRETDERARHVRPKLDHSDS